MNWLKNLKNIVILALLLLATVAVISAVYSWYKPPQTVTKTEYVEVPKIKKVTSIKEVKVPGPKEIVTIEKEKIVQVLNLPEWFKTDTNKQAIATAEIPPYKGKTNVVGIIDTDTGKGSIIAKQMPLSLFELVNEKEVGVRYGYRAESGGFTQETTIYGKWDFLRVGNSYVGATVEANTRGEGKALVSVGYRF